MKLFVMPFGAGLFARIKVTVEPYLESSRYFRYLWEPTAPISIFPKPNK